MARAQAEFTPQPRAQDLNFELSKMFSRLHSFLPRPPMSILRPDQLKDDDKVIVYDSSSGI